MGGLPHIDVKVGDQFTLTTIHNQTVAGVIAEITVDSDG